MSTDHRSPSTDRNGSETDRLGHKPTPANDRFIERIRAVRSGDDWAALLRLIALNPAVSLDAVLSDAKGSAAVVPSMPASATGVPAGLWDALGWLARRHGFTIGRSSPDGAESSTDWAKRRIVVRSDIHLAEANLLLLHELAHVLLHDNTQHPSTAGCRGTAKIEANSVAFVVAARLGIDTAGYTWPFTSSWAGSDRRARPEAAVLATASRVAAAARTIINHLDVALFGRPPSQVEHVSPIAVNSPAAEPADVAATQPLESISRVLQDAEQFYIDCRDRSWAPRYLVGRRLAEDDIRRWRIGYAPATWTALLDHLRALGHDDELITAAGLARRSSRGTLIDHFRDRVMLAIRTEAGTIAGFIGRAKPTARPEVPKYLNTPETPAYTKGDLLFGLYENRRELTRGAVPVIVEGPFDAIAVTAADPHRYAGLAPCGTALTARQVAVLARLTDISDHLVLVALDGDRAGREAALKAYPLLSLATSKLEAVMLPNGRDPADILRAGGATALASVLRQQAEPLARVVIDAHLDRRAAQLRFAEGQLNALRDTASYVASMLPSAVAEQILAITGGQQLRTIDERMRPVANPELARIAVALPAGSACQIVRIAERLGLECSEVTAAVANAVTTMNLPPTPLRTGRLTSRDFPRSVRNLEHAERGPPVRRPPATTTSRPTRRNPH